MLQLQGNCFHTLHALEEKSCLTMCINLAHNAKLKDQMMPGGQAAFAIVAPAFAAYAREILEEAVLTWLSMLPAVMVISLSHLDT